jgi:GT2 family glycosyltransferase
MNLPGNPGYAAAVNAGAVEAAGEVTVFMNDDLGLDADAVLRLGALVSEGNADVAVPRLVLPDGQTERTIFALPTPGALALEWMALPDVPVPGLRRVLHPEKWRSPDARQTIRAAAATVVACDTELLRKVPLPEAYFLYWEEAEWFWDLAALDKRVLFVPDVVAAHAGGRGDVRPEKSRLLARNAVRCVRRTQGRAAAALAWMVVVLWNARLVAVDVARRSPVVRARLAGLAAAVRAIAEVR